MSDEKVVEFRIRRREAADDEPLERLARAPRAECEHPRFILDAKQRTVACGECGAWLDPVWCLIRFLEADERVENRIRYMRDLEKQNAERRERAIARRQKAIETAKREVVAANCQACDGTGWRRVPPAPGAAAMFGGGVVRCECRKSGARLL